MEQEFKFPIVAFGSNTNLDDLDRYALLHGYPTGCLRFSELVSAPDYKLAFTKHSKGRRGGVLDLLYSIGHVTTVALFYANESGLELLKQKKVSRDIMLKNRSPSLMQVAVKSKH